jgi:transposase
MKRRPATPPLRRSIKPRSRPNDQPTRLTEATQEKQDDPTVLSLIRDLKNGTLAGSSLAVNDRRLCVEHLTAEGFSIVEIAEILKTSERTIKRDRACIRSSHAVQASPELTSEMVGNLLREAEVATARIRKVTRGSEVEPMARIEGEKACWVITRDLVSMLQRLGYLPTAPQVIQGQLTHDFGNGAPDYSEIQAELERLETIVQQSNGGEISSEIVQVKDVVMRLALSEQVKHITASITKPETEDSEGVDGRSQ